jgi:hypothetical protein
MDRPARLFLCARCRVQVVLCSRCDRGNRYCSRSCGRQVREASQRAAGSRYQRSRRGRIAHAERSRRWRRKHASRGDAAGGAHNVTHQGCPPGVGAAPLVAWKHDGAASNLDDTPATPATQDMTPAAPWHCRRCAAAQPAWVRQGFLRHSTRAGVPSTSPPGRRHDHWP